MVKLFTLYWKHVLYNSCTSSIWVLYFISILLDRRLVLDLNQPFNWKTEIWESFKMKLMWGPQSWTLHLPSSSRCQRGGILQNQPKKKGPRFRIFPCVISTAWLRSLRFVGIGRPFWLVVVVLFVFWFGCWWDEVITAAKVQVPMSSPDLLFDARRITNALGD